MESRPYATTASTAPPRHHPPCSPPLNPLPDRPRGEASGEEGERKSTRNGCLGGGERLPQGGEEHAKGVVENAPEVVSATASAAVPRQATRLLPCERAASSLLDLAAGAPAGAADNILVRIRPERWFSADCAKAFDF